MSSISATPLPRSSPPNNRPFAGQHRAEHAAWAFYLVAAVGSSVGQIWVAVDIPPWPATVPWWARALIALPFAVVIDLGGVVAAAFADARRRLGEDAYGWRILSAATVTLGVTINVSGHRGSLYLAAVFGGLGVFAYTVWLLHSAARRRDALRAAGKLVDTAPVYGVAQWWREPAVTRRARDLAVAHGYPVQQSLAAARRELRNERRTTALTVHIEKLIHTRQDDPVLADIAVTTLDIDAVAAALTAQADVGGWARAIGVELVPPQVEPATTVSAAADLRGTRPELPKDLLRRVPVRQPEYDFWRQVWQDWQTRPDDNHHSIAEQHHISARQAQWIRTAGNAGLLDSEAPPLSRLLRLVHSDSRTATTPPPPR